MILAGNISPVQGGVYKYIAPRRSVLISTTRSSCMSCICASTDQVDGFPNVKRGEHSNNTGIWKIIPSLIQNKASSGPAMSGECETTYLVLSVLLYCLSATSFVRDQ